MGRITLLLAIFFAVPAFSQNYTPTSNWPYLYEDFQSGWITLIGGRKIECDNINLSLANSRVHYVQDDKIMEASPDRITLLKIGSDSFVFASGSMVKILLNTQHAAVVEKCEIDLEAMNKADIGYGKSSIASTQNISLAAFNLEYAVNKSLDDILGKRNSGTELKTNTVKGIFYKGVFVPASRYDILNIPDIDKNAVKDFIKKQRINYKKNEDLAKLVDFLYELL